MVIGGGIHGVAAACDAAQRGLSVALVEAQDFGAGVSWNSLKTIHGGLRHLQRADLAQARESMRERRALLRIAPAHRAAAALPRARPTATGCAGGRPSRGPAPARLIGRDRNEGLPPERHIPPSRVLSAAEVRRHLPGLDDHAA